MDLTLVRELAPLGVGGILAAIMFSWHRADMIRLLKESRMTTDILVGLVDKNTAALTALTKVVERCEGVRRDR